MVFLHFDSLTKGNRHKTMESNMIVESRPQVRGVIEFLDANAKALA